MVVRRYLTFLMWFFVILSAAIGATSVAAQTGNPSDPQIIVTANAGEGLPDNFTISVDYGVDSDLNSRLRTIFEQELEAQAYRLSATPNFILFFETFVDERLEPNKSISIVGQGGNRSRPDLSFKFLVPLKPLNPAVGSRRYSLNVTLARKGDSPVWAASAVATAAGDDRFVVQSSMARAVIGALGRSVEPLSIQSE